MTNAEIIRAIFPEGLYELNAKHKSIALRTLRWCRAHANTLVRDIPKTYDIEEVLQKAVNDVSGMYYHDIISRGRQAEKVKWRYIIVRLMYDYSPTTLCQIGAKMGYDHSTMSHAIRAVVAREWYMADYARLKEAFEKELDKTFNK